MPGADFNYLERLDGIRPGAGMYVYGNGMTGQFLVSNLRDERPDINILAIVDKFVEGEYEGIPIISLDAFRASNRPYDLIAATPLNWIDEVVSDLSFVPAGKLAVNMIGDCSFHSDYRRHAFRGHERQAEEVAAMLPEGERGPWALVVAAMRDRTMRPLFENFRSRFKKVSVDDNYLQYVTPPRGGVVIEGGVFDGGTTLRFASVVGAAGRVFAFDPLGDRYARETLNKATADCAPIEVQTMALWNEEADLSFTDHDAGTRVKSGGDQSESVHATSIDAFMAARRIDRLDFIKLDVEGAEPKVLEGAVESIRKHRPFCAVCIYHGVDQFFSLPLFFRDHFENYKYNIDFYSPDGLETVLYCSPRERIPAESTSI
jgi:FkbM family methyltransferase